jgi:hypothetical protein
MVVLVISPMSVQGQTNLANASGKNARYKHTARVVALLFGRCTVIQTLATKRRLLLMRGAL